MLRTLSLSLVLFGTLACKAKDTDTDTDTDTDSNTETGDTQAVEDSGDVIDSGDVGSLYGVPPSSPITLPSFTAKNRDGTERGPNDLRDARSIIWFFPAAATYG